MIGEHVREAIRFAEEYGYNRWMVAQEENNVLVAVAKAANRADLFHSSACPMVSEISWDSVIATVRRECTCGIEELRYRLRVLEAITFPGVLDDD